MKGRFLRAALPAALAVMLLLSGCSDAGEAVVEKSTASAGNTSSEMRTVQFDLDDEDCFKTLDFGSDSAFDGILVEEDENGELIFEQTDGCVLVKVSDERFDSVSGLQRFISKSMSSGAAAFIESISKYFTDGEESEESEDGLYITSGGTVSSVKKDVAAQSQGDYTMTMTLSAIYDGSSSYSKAGFEFHKTEAGWKLVSITLYY